MLARLMPVSRVKVLAFLLLNASEEYYLRVLQGSLLAVLGDLRAI